MKMIDGTRVAPPASIAYFLKRAGIRTETSTQAAENAFRTFRLALPRWCEEGDENSCTVYYTGPRILAFQAFDKNVLPVLRAAGYECVIVPDRGTAVLVVGPAAKKIREREGAQDC